VLAAAVLSLLWLLPALWAAGAPAAHAAGPMQTTGVPAAQIALSTITPGVVRPTDPVTVTGTIRNVGTAPIMYLTARLHLLRDRLGTRDQLDDWTRGDTGTGTVVGRTVDLFPSDDPALAPGSLVAFTLTLSQAELGLAGASFGSYGLAVEARGQLDGPRTEVGLLRTSLVWAPDTSYVPQQLAWLVPFTGLTGGLVGGPSTSSAGASASAGTQDLTLEQLAAAVAPGSRLRHLLEAAAAPGVGWAVDPALLRTLRDAAGSRTEAPPTSTSSPTSSASTATSASTPSSVPPSGSTGPTTPTAAGTPTGPTSKSTSRPDATSSTETPDAAARRQIRSFLADLAAAAPGRTIVELPYGDPDVQAVADAGQPQLLHAAEALGAGTVAEVLGVPAATDVAWPADGWADDHALTALSDDGTRAVVLDARSRPLTDSLGYTPDARSQLPQGLVGWLSDPGLSRLAAAARLGDVLQRQQLLAQTASLTTERPGLARRVLVALPRGVDLDPVAFRGMVDAVEEAPWVRTVAPADLRRPLDRGDTSSLERRPARLPAALRDAQLSVHDVGAAQTLRADLAALGEVLASPSEVTGDLQRDTVSLLSAGWRGHAAALAARRAVVTRHVHDLVGALHVLPTRANLLATNASLPFTVVNDLDQQVTGLRLRVTAPNPRLQVRQETTDPLEVAPGTRIRVEVPVRAIAAGRVSLTAQLLTPSGRELGAPVSVQVRTQPPGTWAMWVVGAVVALVLLVGIVRAVRRPRREVLMALDGAADDDPTGTTEPTPTGGGT
jgi:hypothetical protein